MVSTLQTFSTVDVRCRHRCGRSMLQTFDVNEKLNIANVSVQHSKRSLPPRLNSHVHIIMFIYTAMKCINLPQLFC